MGDSIIRGVNGIPDTFVDCRPGKVIKDITKIITAPDYDIKQFDVVLVHVGTNDLKQSTGPEMLEAFEQLASAFHGIHSWGWLLLSSILPRPRDEKYTRQKVHFVNNELFRKYKESEVTVLKTYSPFTKKGWADKQLFKRDGLHPAVPDGVRVLKSFFHHQLSHKVLKPRLRDAVQYRHITVFD